MPGGGDTLTVGKHTTLQDVQNFVERVGGDDRIHGKYNEKTGETILYVGKKSPSLLSKIFGNWVERRETAKLAIFNVMDKALKQTARDPSLSDTERAKLETLRDSIVESTNSIRGHSMRKDMITLLAQAVQGGMEGSRKTEVPDGQSLLGQLGEFDRVISWAANNLHLANVGRGDPETAGEQFGVAIVEKFLTRHGDDKNLVSIISTLDRDAFKAELREALARSERGEGKHLVSTKEAEIFLDTAFDHMMSLLNSNREVPDTSTPIEKKDGQTVHLPNIRIGDTTYQPVRYLGSGLYSDVYAYVALDGSGKEIAYKISQTLHLPEITIDGATYAPSRRLEPGETEVPYRALDGSGKEYIYRIEIPPEAMDEFRNEIRSHAMLARGNHPNVVGLEGVIRMPNGQFGVAVEMAPGGDVLEFSGKLQDSIGTGEGKIAPEMAEIVRLTLLRDMALGLGYIQTQQESMHLDLKTPNVLIGGDGKAKISDFGLTQKGTHAPIHDLDLPDNPIWSAPETRAGLNELKVMQQAMREVETGKPTRGIWALAPTLNSKTLKDIGSTVQSEIKDTLPKVSDHTIRTLTTNIMKPDHAKLQNEVEITGKSDTWALGIMTLDVWTGREQFRDKEFFTDDDETPQFLPGKVSDRIREFGSEPNNQAIGFVLDEHGNQVNRPLFESTGNIEIDGLVNRLLDPTPQSRPGMQDVINDPIFDKPGVQSEQVYALIRALAKGDPTEIDEASRALQDMLRQPQLQ